MGCIGCQCLGPKKSLEEVYIKIIKQIHEEAKKVGYNQPKNPNFHNAIMERLIKKGELRKLTDNLSSRRHKIQDALILNFKLTSQSKQLATYHACLIVADSISQVAYPKKLSLQPQKLVESDVSEEPALKKSASNTTMSQKRLTSSIEQHLQHRAPAPGVDEQYIKTIIFLFDCDQSLRPSLLDSLNSFSKRHAGTIDRQFQVWKLVNLIIEGINRNIEREKGCQVVKNLIIHTRDQVNENMKNRNIILSFFRLWLEEQKSLQLTSLTINCEQILSIFFHRFISSWQSEFLYQSIFAIFDEIQFDKVNQPLIENLCQDLVDQIQLKSNFKRCMFNYLIAYLSIVQENSNAKKWLMNSLGINLQNIRILFKNLFKENIKIEGFKRLNSWIDKKYVSIHEFCLYNSKALVYVFTANLTAFNHHKDDQVHNLILKQFSKLLQKLQKEQKIKLIQICLEQFQEQELLLKEQQEMVLLIKQVIHSKDISRQQIQHICMWMPIDFAIDIRRNIQIMKLNKYLLDLMESKSKLSQDSKSRICELLYSFYQVLTYENIGLNQKYQMMQIVIRYIQELCKKIGKAILIPYYVNIAQKIAQNRNNLSIYSQLCLIIFNFNLRKIINNAELPLKLNNLAIKLEKKQNKQELLGEINSYFFERDPIQTNLQIPASLALQKQEYEKKMNSLFNMKPGDRLESIMERKETYTKQSSMNINSEAESNQSQDESFQDALDIILKN